ISKTFALALFMVFGTVLFSCTDHQDKMLAELEIKTEQLMQNLTGDLMTAVTGTNPVNKNIGNTQNAEKHLRGDVAVQEFVEGEVAVRPENDTERLGGKPVIQIVEEDSTEKFIKGKMKMPVYKETAGEVQNENCNLLPVDKTKNSDNIMTTGDTVLTEQVFMAGMVAIEQTAENTETLVNTFTVIEENTSEIPTSDQNNYNFGVYPNPGKGEFTIKYEVINRSDVRVDVLDGSGRFLTNVVDVNG